MAVTGNHMQHPQYSSVLARLIATACALMICTQTSMAAATDGGADEPAAPVKLITLGSMTWSFYDQGAVNAYPTESAEVAVAMNQALNNYNTMGAFAGNVPVTYVTWGGVTAQASYQGSIQFGYQRTGRAAQHEMSHFMGMAPGTWGGTANWSWLCNGGWTGTRGLARMASFVPGAGIGCSSDNGHFWDHGLNQDGEYNWLSKGRNVAMVGAMRSDIGLSDGTVLPDAPYRLVSKNTGRPVADKNAIELGEVVEATSTMSRKQAWMVSFMGGYIRLKNMSSQRFLDGSGGTATLVTANAPAARQAWEMIPTNDGYFMLRNQQTNRCLKSVSAGASLQLADCDTNTWAPAATFEFKLAKPATPQGMPDFDTMVQIAPSNYPTYRLVTNASNAGVLVNFPQSPTAAALTQAGGVFHVRRGLADPLCVSLESASQPKRYLRHQGFKMLLATNDETTLVKADTTFCPMPGLAGAQFVTLQSFNIPGYVLRHQGFQGLLSPKSTNALLMADATFAITPVSAASAAPVMGTLSSRCIDVAGASTANGAKVQLSDCSGATNQAWVYTANKELKGIGGKCLDAEGVGTANGTKIHMWDCTGGSNQKWTLNADGSAVGEGSGRCLDPVGQGSSNGTPLQLLDCNGTANQKWRFK